MKKDIQIDGQLSLFDMLNIPSDMSEYAVLRK